MSTIPHVAQRMQTVLGEVAVEAAQEKGFVQRKSKMGGAAFAQTLAFGWLDNPQATLEELAQTAGALGVTITPQGLDQRFTESAANYLPQVLEVAIDQVITAERVAIPILQRFSAVYLDDSSTVVLPNELGDVWQGCGGRTTTRTQAALKIQVRLDFTTGAMKGPFLQAGRVSDRRSPLQRIPVVADSLRIADLGYWSLDVLEMNGAQQGYWLSRIQVQTVVYDENGKQWDLLSLLMTYAGPKIDMPIWMSAKYQLPARLLAIRVPQEVADQRRRRLHEEARSRGQAVSKARLALADWNIFATNAPVDLLTLPEALVLARTRWQIELLFKLWKSHGQIDEWRSRKPWRILCEVYAKLTAMIIQHWLLLISCWAYPDRSLFKAAKTVRKHALNLVCAFYSTQQLCRAIATIQRCLSAGCRINRRKTRPNTYQLLLDPTLLAWEGLT